jgi:hypothetical protein
VRIVPGAVEAPAGHETGKQYPETLMSTSTPSPTGNCPSCHRADVCRRVVIGEFERDLCRMCADSYKRSPGIVVEILVLDD